MIKKLKVFQKKVKKKSKIKWINKSNSGTFKPKYISNCKQTNEKTVTVKK